MAHLLHDPFDPKNQKQNERIFGSHEGPSPVNRFIYTPMRDMPTWIRQNILSLKGYLLLRRRWSYEIEHRFRYSVFGKQGIMMLAFGFIGAVIQHQFHEAQEGGWPPEKYLEQQRASAKADSHHA